jgi:hypothetical protein
VVVRALFRYLERNGTQSPQVLQVAPALQQAVQLFAANNYNQSLVVAYQCYLAINVLRASTATLPAPALDE